MFEILPQRITLRIVYTLDDKIADQKVFNVIIKNQEKKEIGIE